MNKISTLQTQVSTCQVQSNSSFTGVQVNTTVYSQLVSEYAYDIFDRVTPTQYKTISRLSNNNVAKQFEVGGDLILNTISPEPQSYLQNSGDDTLVRDMQVRVKIRLASKKIEKSFVFIFYLLTCTHD